MKINFPCPSSVASTPQVAQMFCNSRYITDAEGFIDIVLNAWKLASGNNHTVSEDHERHAEEVFLLYRDVRCFDDSYYDIHPAIAMIIGGALKSRGLDAALTMYADIKFRLYTRLH